jgi:phage FluMu protein Com
MTIREYIKSRGRVVRKFSLIWVVTATMLGFALSSFMDQTVSRNWWLFMVITLVVVTTAIERQAKCPRCKRALSKLVYESAWRTAGNIPDRVCPHCKVNLDEPMDSHPEQ